MLPSFVIMPILAAGYVTVTALPAIRPAVNGLTAAAVGIWLATAWRFAQRNIDLREPATVAVALVPLVAGEVLGVNVALIVILSGLVGIALFAARASAAEAPGAGAR